MGNARKVARVYDDGFCERFLCVECAYCEMFSIELCGKLKKNCMSLHMLKTGDDDFATT